MRVFGFLIFCLLQFSCASQETSKINGVSFVASREAATQKQVEEVLKVHANHVAVMPFGFMRDINAPEVVFNTNQQWFGETKKGAKQYIQILQKNGIEVMVKPQIWIWRGEFTGKLKMNSEEKWKAFETSYESFIMTYANLAEETNAAIFCLGTELEEFVKNRPVFWHNLIKKVRSVYKGKLTYAANWDEYTRTPFWEEVDYIGIDAYFPLSQERVPSVEQLKLGWQPWKEKIQALSKDKNKPVLFTEFGYRSMDYTAKKPWLVDRNDEKVNLKAQANATEAIFSEFWNEEWFSGGYIWKWFIHHDTSGGDQDNRFTPQNKPAQDIMVEFYNRD